MKALRPQGETLAAIGERFGLSAERVRQIPSS
jgi:DNA-directed RNA polymerase sigma subunit (sigma70/sigma32)